MYQILHQTGNLNVSLIGETYETAYFRVNYKDKMLFVAKKEGESVSYAKGVLDFKFLHKSTKEKLDHAQKVTGLDRLELVSRLIGSSLKQLKNNKFKI